MMSVVINKPTLPAPPTAGEAPLFPNKLSLLCSLYMYTSDFMQLYRMFGTQRREKMVMCLPQIGLIHLIRLFPDTIDFLADNFNLFFFMTGEILLYTHTFSLNLHCWALPLFLHLLSY